MIKSYGFELNCVIGSRLNEKFVQSLDISRLRVNRVPIRLQ